jgi:hypothetical protein
VAGCYCAAASGSSWWWERSRVLGGLLTFGSVALAGTPLTLQNLRDLETKQGALAEVKDLCDFWRWDLVSGASLRRLFRAELLKKHLEDLEKTNPPDRRGDPIAESIHQRSRRRE